MAIYNYYQLPLAEYLRQFHLNGRQKEIELSANLVMKINHHWLVLVALINKILKKCLFLLCLVGWDIKSARQAKCSSRSDSSLASENRKIFRCASCIICTIAIYIYIYIYIYIISH
jgi:uncharacterized membrane protein